MYNKYMMTIYIYAGSYTIPMLFLCHSNFDRITLSCFIESLSRDDILILYMYFVYNIHIHYGVAMMPYHKITVR